jgi:hypothetical protein
MMLAVVHCLVAYRRFSLFTVAVALLQTGCADDGPKTFPVTGKVTHQGEPLPFGAVTFVPTDGPAGSARIEPDGTYRAELVPGAHRVAVMALPPRQGRPDPTQEGGLDTTGFPEPKSLIPEKYNHYDSSNVEIEVKESSENVINIDLP